MALLVTCSHCQTELQVPDEFVGKRLRCPSCKSDVLTGPAPVQRAQPESAESSAQLARLEEAILQPRRALPVRGERPSVRAYPGRGPRADIEKPKSIGMIIGVVLGISTFLVLIAAVLWVQAPEGPRRVPAPPPNFRFAQPPNIAQPPWQPDMPFDPNQFVQRDLQALQEADKLNQAGKHKEACVFYRKALDLNPKNADAYFGLIRSLPPGEPRDDLQRRFAQLDDQILNFERFAEDCRNAGDGENLLEIAQAMRRLDPDYLPAEYYLALAKAWTGQPEDAAALFKQLVPRVQEDKKSNYQFWFLQAMAGSNQAALAYDAVPNARDAFRYLASELKRQYFMDELRQLVKLHARKHADDPLLPLYEAELLINEGNFKLAEAKFVQAMTRPAEANVVQTFHYSRVLAKFRTGQILSAYKEIGPRDETFQQLAQLCWFDKKYADLQALLDEHVKAIAADNPQPPAQVNLLILQYRWRLKIKDQQFDQAVALLKSALLNDPDDASRKAQMNGFLYDMIGAGKALEAYDTAIDAEQALQILAQNLRGQGKRKELLSLLDKHRQRQPNDVWVVGVEAELASDDKAWDKAIRLLQPVWDKGSNGFRDRFRWTYIHAMYKAGRTIEAYEKFEPNEQTFTQLAGNLIADKKGAELLELVKAQRRRVGSNAQTAFNEARARILMKQTGHALALFKMACEQADPGQRQMFAGFVIDMEEQGQGLKAYRVCSDKTQAFRNLANHLVWKKKVQVLDDLIDEHERFHGPDLWTLHYEGESLLLHNEPEKAEKKFAAAQAKASVRDRWTFRNGVIRAKIMAGNVVAAYKEMGQNARTFEDLANQCFAQKNSGQLQALIAAHRQAHPDDPHVLAWEVQSCWLAKDYARALQLLDSQPEEVANLSKHRWKYDAYRVRCLAKLKQTDKAIEVAESLAKKNQIGAVLVVLAHASSGDAKKAIAVVDRYSLDRFLVGNCYRDEDLGPILRGESFAEFRAKHPEPMFPLDPLDPDDFDR